ncbi:hypothetical protein EYF80_052538 [Liparis tanakae]|uniref:Uncharacterized protein n=1 Tax=Liparis tanakae TaxID=230148 RepID=A0A4Z2F832_9TELE|nr:hypothetical protein EYF80_052538 [Liparis tanakae]
MQQQQQQQQQGAHMETLQEEEEEEEVKVGHPPVYPSPPTDRHGLVRDSVLVPRLKSTAAYSCCSPYICLPPETTNQEAGRRDEGREEEEEEGGLRRKWGDGEDRHRGHRYRVERRPTGSIKAWMYCGNCLGATTSTELGKHKPSVRRTLSTSGSAGRTSSGLEPVQALFRLTCTEALL